MFVNARKDNHRWLLADPWGHEFVLPCRPDYAGRRIRIGTLGTKFEPNGLKDERRKALTRTTIMAHMLRDLGAPIYLLDVRRNGTGAQSSWSPAEFSSLIPAAIGSDGRYGFLHLPILAPSTGLLGEYHKGQISDWHDFRDRYNGEADEGAIAVACAFAEAADCGGGMAVFLCAEPYCPDFDTLPAATQDANHCHRFTLAHRVARQIQQACPTISVERVDLDPGEYATRRKAGQPYEPHIVAL